MCMSTYDLSLPFWSVCTVIERPLSGSNTRAAGRSPSAFVGDRRT